MPKATINRRLVESMVGRKVDWEQTGWLETPLRDILALAEALPVDPEADALVEATAAARAKKERFRPLTERRVKQTCGCAESCLDEG